MGIRPGDAIVVRECSFCMYYKVCRVACVGEDGSVFYDNGHGHLKMADEHEKKRKVGKFIQRRWLPGWRIEADEEFVAAAAKASESK